MSTRGGDDGFTLVEALVAMAVLAVGAVGLLSAVERHAQLARGLGDRTVARWAAENRMAEIELGLSGITPSSETLMGQDWRSVADLKPTTDPDLVQVDVSVVDAAGGGTEPLLRLSGFVDVTKLPQEMRP